MHNLLDYNTTKDISPRRGSSLLYNANEITVTKWTSKLHNSIYNKSAISVVSRDRNRDHRFCKRSQSCELKRTHHSPVAVASTRLVALFIAEVIVGEGVGVVLVLVRRRMKCYRETWPLEIQTFPFLFFFIFSSCVDLAGYFRFFRGSNWGCGYYRWRFVFSPGSWAEKFGPRIFKLTRRFHGEPWTHEWQKVDGFVNFTSAYDMWSMVLWWE